MDELKKFVSRVENQYKNLGVYNITYEKEKCSKLIANLFLLNYMDCPDGYFYDEEKNIVYIYEHFEIDCSPHNKKGSRLRTNLSTVNRNVEQEMQNNEKGEIIQPIEQGYSYQNDEGNIVYEIGKNGDKYRNNYINSFNVLFDNHHNHLELYKKNCSRHLNIINPNFQIIFVIEDVTIGGTFFLKGRGPGKPVFPLISKQFQEKLLNSNVDYIIFNSVQGGLLSILDKECLNEKNINKSIDLNNEEFYVAPAMINITCYKKFRLPE